MSDLLVYVIADYGHLHDLAFAEVTQKLYGVLGGLQAHVKAYAVPAFDTQATGFALAQTAINSQLGKSQKFFVNTAPRKDDLTPRVSNSGEGLVYAKLFNDVEIVAVNSGYSLSFIKEAATEIRQINCNTDGSQFRSRDIFPISFGKILHGDYSELGEDVRAHIPDVPENIVCYTDGYGNMKCSIDPKTLEPLNGQDVIIEINGRQQLVRVGQGIFGVADGQFCLSVGSSGWTLPNGTKHQFCEIVKRGGNAADVFSTPHGGRPITIKKVA